MRAEDYVTLADVVRPIGGAVRDKTALIVENRAFTYAEIDRRTSVMANQLVQAGVKPGDRIAVLSKNNAGFVELIFAIAKAGAVLVPLNWRLSSTEIGYIVGDAAPSMLFIEHGLEGLVPADAIAGRTVIGFADTDFDLAGSASDKQPDIAVDPDDVAMLIYTSGTTGHPKGAMITHRNFIRHCGLDAPETPSWWGISRDEICLVVLPLFHVGGLELLLRPLFTGATVVLHRDFDIERILADIDRHKVTMTGLVPTALQMMLAHPRSAEVDFTSLDKFLYGAAPIPVGLLKEGLDRMRCDFVGTYGMTESNGVMAMLAPADHHDRDADRLRSTGKPTFATEVRIVDDDGADLPAGEIGEILVRGSGVMKGYWNRPDATAEAIDADGWLRSGDAGYLDADGFLYIKDRVKDMICSGGENIYPAEVESAIYGHPAIAEVAVVGVPHDRWGECVHAVVVAKPGMVVDADDVLGWARARIASYKRPKTLEVVDMLPKNAAGKILRRAVRDRLKTLPENV